MTTYRPFRASGRNDGCAHVDEPMRLIDRRGRDAVLRVCIKCDRSDYVFLAKAQWPEDWELLPVWKDNSRLAVPSECARCGVVTTDIEVHHWAPHSLFRDPDEWPTSMLCVPCHREWHQVTGCSLAHGGPS